MCSSDLFVRQYAEAVGMDGEQTLREFLVQTGISLEVPFEERKVSPYTPESIQKYHAKLWRNVGFAAAGVLGIVLLIVYLWTHSGQDQAAETPPAPRPRPSRRRG